MLLKPKISAGLMGHLARKQTLPSFTYVSDKLDTKPPSAPVFHWLFICSFIFAVGGLWTLCMVHNGQRIKVRPIPAQVMTGISILKIISYITTRRFFSDSEETCKVRLDLKQLKLPSREMALTRPIQVTFFAVFCGLKLKEEINKKLNTLSPTIHLRLNPDLKFLWVTN